MNNEQKSQILKVYIQKEYNLVRGKSHQSKLFFVRKSRETAQQFLAKLPLREQTPNPEENDNRRNKLTSTIFACAVVEEELLSRR